MGDLDGAISDSAPGIELASKRACGRYVRGLARGREEDYGRALADLYRAVELDPREAEIYTNRGMARPNLGDQVGAISDHTSAIKLNHYLTSLTACCV
jgi:Flp pilus assembly protein TadD